VNLPICYRSSGETSSGKNTRPIGRRSSGFNDLAQLRDVEMTSRISNVKVKNPRARAELAHKAFRRRLLKVFKFCRNFRTATETIIDGKRKCNWGQAVWK
jgi:hypothetical protein